MDIGFLKERVSQPASSTPSPYGQLHLFEPRNTATLLSEFSAKSPSQKIPNSEHQSRANALGPARNVRCHWQSSTRKIQKGSSVDITVTPSKRFPHAFLKCAAKLFWIWQISDRLPIRSYFAWRPASTISRSGGKLSTTWKTNIRFTIICHERCTALSVGPLAASQQNQRSSGTFSKACLVLDLAFHSMHLGLTSVVEGTCVESAVDTKSCPPVTM